MNIPKITVSTLLKLKTLGEKISALTAYDTPTAQLIDQSGIDIILVGDSVGNVKLGYENTLPVTVDEILHHLKAVRRGVKRALLVADLPYLSYHLTIDQMKEHVGRFVKEGGAEAVKLEGGKLILPMVVALKKMSIPVIGHLGLTPQSIHAMGGYKTQGRSTKDAKTIFSDALALEKAGVCAIVLECIPNDLSRKISRKLKIPTIGIGAGLDCDGQILVVDDMVGLTPDPIPSFVRRYAKLREPFSKAIRQYQQDVKSKRFP